MFKDIKFSVLLHDIKSAFKDLLPIIVVVAFFQAVVIQKGVDNLASIVIGLSIVVVGLAFFIRGLELGIFPIGESLAHDFARKGSLYWLLAFAFLIGFSTTIAEPALIAVANKASIISEGKIEAFSLRLTVAVSVGCAIALGVYRIIIGNPIQYYIIAGYVVVVILTFFAPPEIVGLAYDSGGVTTSTVTVPLVAAIGIGLSTVIKGRNPAIDGFGLIAFASLTPMIFVQFYGIVVYNFFESSEVVATLAQENTTKVYTFEVILLELVSVIKDLLPILGIIAFFQFVIIKKAIQNIKKVAVGILFVIIGLYLFIIGLELGLFPIGSSMATQLTQMDNNTIIYLFGFLIGFSTTMAEPALIAIAMKAEEISNGGIREFVLRLSVAVGVAIGIALGAYRIVSGDSIQYYIMAGYVIVIILTFFAPRYIIPIAYDSGGVTTSTVTVPLVAALGIGLATNIEGRSPLIDGFGLIAFASLFPMITVMGYGVLSQYLAKEKK